MSTPSVPRPTHPDDRVWSNRYRRGRRRVIGVLFLALPWAWFLVRDRWAPLNAASVGMPAIAVAAAMAFFAGAAVSRRLLPVFAAVSFLAMTAVTIVQPMLPQPAGRVSQPVTIASANIYEANRIPAAAAAALVATKADVLVAVEVPAGFGAVFRAAAERSHPYEAVGTSIVIRSRYPIAAVPLPSRLSSNRALMATVRPPGRSSFTVIAIHAINPVQDSSFSAQQDFIERLDQSALERQRAAGPVVIAGDLNLSDRTHGYRILSADFRDAMRAGAWAGDTYVQGIWRLALLRIDHLFVSRTWCAGGPARFEVPGSDHLGIRAAIGPCA